MPAAERVGASRVAVDDIARADSRGFHAWHVRSRVLLGRRILTISRERGRLASAPWCLYADRHHASRWLRLRGWRIRIRTTNCEGRARGAAPSHQDMCSSDLRRIVRFADSPCTVTARAPRVLLKKTGTCSQESQLSLTRVAHDAGYSRRPTAAAPRSRAPPESRERVLPRQAAPLPVTRRIPPRGARPQIRAFATARPPHTPAGHGRHGRYVPCKKFSTFIIPT